METQRRGSDGRRLFGAEFKREQVARVLRKEITFAELSRELGIDQSVVRRWQHLVDRGSRTAVAADEVKKSHVGTACPSDDRTQDRANLPRCSASVGPRRIAPSTREAAATPGRRIAS